MRYLREDMINKFIFKIMGVNMEGKPKNIRGVVTIRSNCKGSITLGSNVTIMSGKKYNIIGNDFRTVFRTLQNGKIEIGNNVGISNSTVVSVKSVTIEDNVMIGGNCQIFDRIYMCVYRSTGNGIFVFSGASYANNGGNATWSRFYDGIL